MRYDITTYDADKDKFTPQRGVRRGPYSQFGLRKALRKLRTLGYDANRSDPSVYVKRTDQPIEWAKVKQR